MVKYIRASLLLSLTLVLLGGRALAFVSPKDVWLTDNGEAVLIQTIADTVAGFLETEDIILGEFDKLNVQLDQLILEDTVNEIIITRGIDIRLVIDGTWETKATYGDTTLRLLIGELEDSRDITLVYEGSRDITLRNGQIVNLLTQRVEEVTLVEAIPYETVRMDVRSIERGTEEVAQEGIEGKKEVVFAITFVGSQEIYRELLSEYVLQEPIEQLVHVGIGHNVSTHPRGFRYIRHYVMTATAYTSGYQCTGKRPGDPAYGITASGIPVRPGIVAVDPRVIPLGTRLYVEGYGFALAADTGSAIIGHSIDLFHEDLGEAIQFGRQRLNVWVLAEQY